MMFLVLWLRIHSSTAAVKHPNLILSLQLRTATLFISFVIEQKPNLGRLSLD